MRANIIWLLLFTLIVIISSQGCHPYQKSKAFRKVDTLLHKIEKAENSFVIDVNTIEKRYDSIKIKQRYIVENHTKPLDQQLKSLLTSYKGLAANYEGFVKNYKLLKYENERHKKRIRKLKKQLVNAEIKQPKFDSTFKKEQKKINSHLAKVKKLIGKIAHTEKMYQRTNKKITRIYNRLKNKKDPIKRTI